MPGIFGCIDRNGDPVPQKRAIEMASSLKHEEWYIDKFVILDSCVFGTVELESSHDKHNLVESKDKSLACVMRGNVYNKHELGEEFGTKWFSSCLNDARFLIESYENKGLDFVKHLNGLFSLAIYDRGADRVIVANDRYGFYPLFYSVNQEMFAFASETKGVLKSSITPPVINKTAIPEFFTFSFVLGNKTFFRNIKSMLPANMLVYDRLKNRLHARNYWDFTSRHDAHTREYKPLKTYLNEFKKLMKKAVERRVQDKERIGVFLSGGLDSRVVAAFASETDKDIVTFTFGVRSCLQRKIAEEVSRRLGVKNIFYEIPPDFVADYAEKIVYRGDGLIRIRDCHFIALLEKVRRKVDTVLLGTFGPLFGWDRWEHASRLLTLRNKAEVINYLLRSYTTVLPLEEHRVAFTDIFYDEVTNKVAENFRRTVDQIGFDSALDMADYWTYRNHQQKYTFLAFQFMNWYLETRHPFLDKDLVDFFAFALPPKLRIDKMFLQKAVNYCFPSLSNIPLEHDGVPPDSHSMRFLLGDVEHFLKRKSRRIIERLSHGKYSFIKPLDYRQYSSWLRTGSRAYVLRILLNPKTLGRGYFKRDFIERIVREHMTARKNHDQLICDLINLELMSRIFFDMKAK